jgi:phosphotriesterase-related protein
MSRAKREKAGKVQTVLGVIDADDLGVTLPHEHLLIDMAVSFFGVEGAGFKKLAYEPVAIENLSWLWHNPFSSLDNLRLQDEALAIEEVMLFKKEGGNTIVELTNSGLDRDPIGLAHISRVTGINVIMGSGYYVGNAQDPDYDRKTEDEIAEEIIGDIEVGVGNTGICAGIIGEIGCSWPLQDREKKTIRAAARAQQQTGAAINVHPGHVENSPMEIITLLDEAGADINGVVMSHIDRLIHSLSTRRELAKAGCYLEYDLFGSHIFNPIGLRVGGGLPRPCDRERIEQIIELIDAGYLKQILVSQDICMKMKLIRYGGNGYVHILRNIVPHMLRLGITREQIHTIVVENPKRMLQFGAADG